MKRGNRSANKDESAGSNAAIARLYKRLDDEYRLVDFGPGRKRSPLKEKVAV